MAQIEFSYNWYSNQTIGCIPFEVVYSQNLISPLDLVPLLTTQFSGDAEKEPKISRSCMHKFVTKFLSKMKDIEQVLTSIKNMLS